MAVLITGGLGVIGRRLTEHLRERGYDAKVTDVAIRKEPDYLRADVTRYEELSEVFRTWEIDQFLDRDLVLAEVELPSAATEVTVPPWLAPVVRREVTDEPAYGNAELSRTPLLVAHRGPGPGR